MHKARIKMYTIKATGEWRGHKSPVLCFQIGIWSWILSFWANHTQTHTTLTLAYINTGLYWKAFGCIASCITHYYCLIFTTLFRCVPSLYRSFPLSSWCVACVLACVGSLFYACDHESNVHDHKNTFNSFPTCCTLILLSLSFIFIP